MRHVLIIGLGLALAACQTPTVVVEGRTLLAAQDTITAAERGLHQAYQTGLVTKDVMRQVRPIADAADDVAVTARCAYAANDPATVAGALSQLGQIAAAITAAATGKPVPALPAFALVKCSNPAPAAAVRAR